MSEQLKILVVDDDDDIRELCKMLLIQEGYLAHTAADYQEAIKCLASCKFDLLITDIQMPGKSGYDLIRQVQITNPDLPAIIMTGYWALERSASELGVSAIIRKPFLREEFLAAIGSILQSGSGT